MSRLLEMPDASQTLGRRDKAILELFYASGLRLSELVGLNLDDLNLSARVVRVLGKGRKERIVPFHETASSALRAWLPDREGFTPAARAPQERPGRGAPRRTASSRSVDPLFLNYRGGRLSTRSVDKLVRRY